MNTHFTGRWMGPLAVALLAAAAAAQDETSQARRFYFHADLGPAFAEDVDLEAFTPSLSGTLEFDPGVRFDVAMGYQAIDWLAFEVETGFSSYLIDTVDGVGPIDVNDSSLSNIPLLANVVFRYPTQIGLIPFVGAGGGGAASTLDADEVTDYTSFYMDGSDTDFVLAYQLFGGLRYQIGPNMALGVVYKYYVSEGPSWDVDTFTSFLPQDQEIETDDMAVHSVSVSFSVHF